MMASMVLTNQDANHTQTLAVVRRASSISEHNREKYEQQCARRRGPALEMFIAKHIDNTRLVKADDPDRRSEMISFASVLTLLFALTMIYVWQHFSAIEVGYSVEVHKLQVDRMRESNRELMLMEAELSDPNRIDHISRQLGMDNPAPDQVARQDRPSGTVIAQAQTVALPTN